MYLFKPKRKYLYFIGKSTCIVSILSMLSSLTWADEIELIDKLSAECNKGNKESCAKLAEIAKKHKDLIVRLQAVRMLTDQAILAEIAKKHEDFSLPIESFLENPNFVDQSILTYHAKNGKGWWIRVAAVRNPNLTDQALMFDIAKNDRDVKVGEAALYKLEDQNLLAKIVESDHVFYDNIRFAAVVRITDEEMLARIANESEHRDFKWVLYAAKKLMDISVSKVMSLNPDLTVEACLAHVARNDINAKVRREAVKKITDQAILYEIARKDKHHIVRNAAADSITNQAYLALLIATSDETDYDVPNAAVAKLVDQSLLAKIAKKDKRLSVRDSAKKRLQELKKK